MDVILRPLVCIFLFDRIFIDIVSAVADAKFHTFCNSICIANSISAFLDYRHDRRVIRGHVHDHFSGCRRICIRKRDIDQLIVLVCLIRHIHSRSKPYRRHIALSRSDLRCRRDLMAEEVVLDLKAVLVGDHFSRIDRRRIFRQLVPVKYCRLFRVFMQPCLSVVSCCRRT